MVSTTVIHSGSERVLTSCDCTELCVSWPQAPINGCRNICCVNCFSSAFAQRQYGMLFIWPVIVLFEEKAMVPHSSTLAWKIPWIEKPGRLQSMGSLRVRHDWATSLSLFIFMHWRRKWQPTPVFLPGESQGQRSLVGCLPSMGSHRVGHDWSDLAAAASSYILSPFKHSWKSMI